MGNKGETQAGLFTGAITQYPPQPNRLKAPFLEGGDFIDTAWSDRKVEFNIPYILIDHRRIWMIIEEICLKAAGMHRCTNDNSETEDGVIKSQMVSWTWVITRPWIGTFFVIEYSIDVIQIRGCIYDAIVVVVRWFYTVD